MGGTGAAEVVETVRNPQSFKVHRLMCSELWKLIDKISRIFLDIEEARPGCSMGMQALCSLNRAIEKAKLLLQYCSDSSKLYLAVTGDVIVSRCQSSRNLLVKKLCQVQNWVPVKLVMEISRVVNDLKGAAFILDPSEEEAGRVVRELLRQYASASNSQGDAEIKALQIASLRLHITSSKAILIEKRSIRKLLEIVGDTDPRKKRILTYLLYLLKKYGNIIEKQTESATVHQQGSFLPENSGNGFEYIQNTEVGSSHVGYGECKAQRNMLHKATPEEFLCGISSRLMYDPVVTASGQTYERMWIQKWFSEGNDTCPKTNVKLTSLSLTPNIAVKELILSWSKENGVAIPDPSMQLETLARETVSTSIASLGRSMNDLGLQMDLSNMSFASLDTSYNSDSSRAKMEDDFSLVHADDGSLKYQSAKNCEIELEFLSKLGHLQWESQCKVVEDVKDHLICNPQASYSTASKNFFDPLIKFLRDAHDLDDIKAQKDGFKLLLTFVSKNRSGIPYLSEEAYSLLASYLDSKVTEEVFALMEIVSGHQYCRSKIFESGALTSLVKFLDSQIRDLQGQALKILDNLSLSREICSKIVSLECIPTLVSFFKDDALMGNCISMLKNLCETEEGRISTAETNGCIASIVEVLESDSSSTDQDQEHAVSILLSLCSQREEYCHLAMDEGVVPPLVYLSRNGKERARISAAEVLRLLGDVSYVDEQESSASNIDTSTGNATRSTEKKSSKGSGFFGKKMSIFSKPSLLAPKKKE